MSDPARDGAWFEDVDVETSFRLPPELEKRVLTPALVVDLDAVRRNVKAVVDVIGDVERYRPHLKTTKSRLVWRELLRAGINKFKVATTRELATLVETYHGEYPGAETTPPFRHLDVLVAYPAVGPSLARVGDIARRPENKARVRVSVLVECEDAVNELPDDVGCFVDVNPGMNRTGIALDSKDGVEFTAIPATIRAAWIRDSFHGKSPFRGVHYYEGHISECVDANGRSREDVDAAIESRDERCRASLETLAEARSPYTGPHTIAFAWCTPFLKDFSRRFSPPRVPRFQYLPSTPFNFASDAFELHPDVASYGTTPRRSRARGSPSRGGSSITGTRPIRRRARSRGCTRITSRSSRAAPPGSSRRRRSTSTRRFDARGRRRWRSIPRRTRNRRRTRRIPRRRRRRRRNRGRRGRRRVTRTSSAPGPSSSTTGAASARTLAWASRPRRR
tara:strand:+ start:244 stop:1590 length:1347 start_codon:yes stop_codon:yes gene_type:complete